MEDLTGTWKVTVTSGPAWFKSLNLVRDKKIITGAKGHNVAAGVWSWGSFVVIPIGEMVGVYSNYSYILRYTDLPIIDRVCAVDENKLSGRFYYGGKLVGTFVMDRVNRGAHTRPN